MSTESPKAAPAQTAVAVPLMYANSFSVSVTNADVLVTLMASGQPFANLVMSYSAAKSLAQNMTKAVETIEKTTGHTILSTDELQKLLLPLMPKSS